MPEHESRKAHIWYILRSPEAVARRCSIKKDILKMLQNSQENPCQILVFNKVVA